LGYKAVDHTSEEISGLLTDDLSSVLVGQLAG
jgi:hypothetical protein